jgi:type I restriction enzyme S subunit
MEVKPGYKQTETGVIPEDWELKNVGDLQPFVTSGSRGWARFYSDRGSPFIRITNLSRTSIYPNLEDLRFVDLAPNDSEAARTRLRDGDVLISITADIGIVGLVTAGVPKPAYINQHIALVRFDSTRTCPRFVSYFLASERPQKLFRALTDSGAKAGMNLTTVQQISLALPPTRAEQEAIAEVLSDADVLVESLEQLLAKKRHLKQGAMQELLTGKKRLPGFSGEWGSRTIESLEKAKLLRLSRGQVISKKDIERTPGDYPIYSSSVTGNGTFGYYGDYMFDEELITWSVDGGGHFFHRLKHRFSVTNVCGFMRVDHQSLCCAFIAAQ